MPNHKYSIQFTIEEWDEISNCVTNARREILRMKTTTHSLNDYSPRDHIEGLLERLDKIQDTLDRELLGVDTDECVRTETL
jgi:hypothetical protein